MQGMVGVGFSDLSPSPGTATAVPIGGSARLSDAQWCSCSSSKLGAWPRWPHAFHTSCHHLDWPAAGRAVGAAGSDAWRPSHQAAGTGPQWSLRAASESASGGFHIYSCMQNVFYGAIRRKKAAYAKVDSGARHCRTSQPLKNSRI